MPCFWGFLLNFSWPLLVFPTQKSSQLCPSLPWDEQLGSMSCAERFSGRKIKLRLLTNHQKLKGVSYVNFKRPQIESFELAFKLDETAPLFSPATSQGRELRWNGLYTVGRKAKVLPLCELEAFTQCLLLCLVDTPILLVFYGGRTTLVKAAGCSFLPRMNV